MFAKIISHDLAYEYIPSTDQTILMIDTILNEL